MTAIENGGTTNTTFVVVFPFAIVCRAVFTDYGFTAIAALYLVFQQVGDVFTAFAELVGVHFRADFIKSFFRYDLRIDIVEHFAVMAVYTRISFVSEYPVNRVGDEGFAFMQQAFAVQFRDNVFNIRAY